MFVVNCIFGSINSCVETLIPSVVIVRDGSLERYLEYEKWSFHDGMSALVRRQTRELARLLLHIFFPSLSLSFSLSAL